MTLEEYKKAYREMIVAEGKTGFYVHLSVYAIINALLIFVNLYFVPGVLYFPFPLAGWGVGVAIHYIGAFRLASRDLTKKEAEAEYRARSHEIPR